MVAVWPMRVIMELLAEGKLPPVPDVPGRILVTGVLVIYQFNNNRI